MNTNEQPEQQTVRKLTVLICGGRRWNYREMTFRKLDVLHKKLQFTHVIHGAASGADTLGGLWAKSRGIPLTEYPANWQPAELHGRTDRGAGFKRNQQMLDIGKPNLVIAFPGTGGTADMMRRSRRAGVRVINLHDIVESWKSHTGMGPK